VKFILDTNVVSRLMRGDPEVSERLTTLSRNDVFLPQPAIAEIEYGLARMPKSARQRRLRRRFDIYRTELKRAPWTDDVSQAFGKIKADLERRGVRLEDFDVAFAAHALALDAKLVTDNLDHMRRVRDLRIESWS
jgi:tRNA(fMet)-specific endonuclease VapC